MVKRRINTISFICKNLSTLTAITFSLFFLSMQCIYAISAYGTLRFATPRDLEFSKFSKHYSNVNANPNTNANANDKMELGVQRTPDAIIIGAKKCGTRALLEFLRLNPRVQAPGPEVHFFDKHFHEGFDWYRRQMPITARNQVVLEKSPSYFVGKHVPQRVHDLNPAMKLVLVVRDPITRAISDYTQTHATRHNSTIGTHTFGELVTCDTKRPPMSLENPLHYRSHEHCIDHVNTTVGPIRIGIYHKHLANWLQHFALHQIHIVDGERLISEPALELRAVEKFLGLEPVIKPENFVMDSTKGFQCVRRTDGPVHCLPKSKGRPHVAVSHTVLERLRKFYEHENEKFFQMINRKFNWS